MCSSIAVAGSLWLVNSLILQPSTLPVSPMDVSSQPDEDILYTTPHFWWFLVLSLGYTSNDLRMLKGLWNGTIPCYLNIGVSFSDIPMMYGKPIFGFLVLVLLMFGLLSFLFALVLKSILGIHFCVGLMLRTRSLPFCLLPYWWSCLPCSWVSQEQIVYVVGGNLIQNSNSDLCAWLFGIPWPRFPQGQQMYWRVQKG